jgi:hypothetical protein
MRRGITVWVSPDRGRRVVASCWAAVCCAVVLAGATACGTTHPGPSALAAPSANPLAGLTADQIARKAIADLAAASSVRISGSVGQDGQTAFADLTLSTKGCKETFRIPGQGSMVMIAIGNTTWSKTDGKIGTQMFGMLPAKVRRYLAGKYLKMPNPPGGMTDFCGLGQAASSFGAELKDLVTAKITTISGQPALRLADKRHSTNAYVTISARPEFLHLDVSGQEHVDFTGYNQPVTLTPPPADETVTPAQLEALARQAAG